MKYKVKVPPTSEMGSYVTTASNGYTETKAQCALQDYNSARAHDDLAPIKRMPPGTVYIPIYEHAIQMLTEEGWEDVCTEANRKDAVEQIKTYRENWPGNYRIKRRKED